jgi:hypothetical protein
MPPIDVIRKASASIDLVYSGIAEEARRFMLEAPKIAELTEEAARDKEKAAAAAPKINPMDKLSLAYMLAGR